MSPTTHGTERTDGPGPRVSIVVPTRDRPRLLIRTLRSIAAQTMGDFEVLVVQDGDHDIGPSIAAIGDDRIRTFETTGRHGASAARNVALSAARGKYVAYLDDDDVYRPDHLATLLNALGKGSARVAYSDALRAHVDLHGDDMRVLHRDRPYIDDYDRELLHYRNFIPIPCLLHERSLIDEVGHFDETLEVTEDWEMLLRFSKRSSFVHVPRVTCEFSMQVHGGGLSFDRREAFAQSEVRIRRKHELRVAAVTLADEHMRRQRRRILRGQLGIDGSAAMAHALELLASKTGQAHYRRDLATLQYFDGDARGAEKHLERIVEKTPQDPQARINLAALRLRKGDTRSSLGLLKRLLRQPSPPPAALLLAGDTAVSAGQFDAATKLYRACLGTQLHLHARSRSTNVDQTRIGKAA